MRLKLVRKQENEKCTIGELYVNDQFFGYTLEDVVREPFKKIYGETAIKAGTYRVVLSFSPTFKEELPLLMNVPFFTGIRIHAGNTALDTKGCILVGNRTNFKDRITGSRTALNRLMTMLRRAGRSNAITITIE